MNSSNWAEVNCCRWREGQLMPMGGQSQYAYSFASRCRAIHGWYGLDQVYRIAYLCETELYVDVGGVLTDITPLSGLSPVPYGEGNYGVSSYSGDPTYGLTPPAPSSLVGGYSDGTYSYAEYGTARDASTITAITQLPDVFSLDNFGSVLYAMTSPDSRLLMWDPAVGGRAVEQVPSEGRGPVPHGRCFVVTPERFLMIFGSTQDGTADGGSLRRFAWCDQENPGAWDYANVTSQAGFLDIEPASPIIAALATRTGILVWTGKKAYVSRFLGLPYIYNYAELADNCTPWSPQSAVATSALALWFSEQGLFSYDGTSILPVACMVRPWIDDDIDTVNVRDQACASHVENYNEFWWFFPQNGQPYNTRAAIYNYKEGWWAQARMSRSAGITSSYTVYTIMADGLVAFQHELGNIYGNADLPFAETFDLNIANGSLLTTVKQLLPDVEGAAANVAYSLYYRNGRAVDFSNPNLGGFAEQHTPQKPINQSNGYVDFRTTGRDIRLRIDLTIPAGVTIGAGANQITGNGAVLPVTLGQHLIDAVPRGDR